MSMWRETLKLVYREHKNNTSLRRFIRWMALQFQWGTPAALCMPLPAPCGATPREAGTA